MTQPMATTITRRGWLSRLLMAAAAPVVGATLADPVNAGKKKKKKVASLNSRLQAQRELCEDLGGGTLAEQKHDSGGVTTECKGGYSDGWTCHNTKKNTKCHQQAPNAPTTHAIEGAVPATESPNAGGGDAGGDRPWHSDQPILVTDPVLEPYPGDGSDPVLE